MTEQFFDQKVKELVLRYNYTLNPIGVYEAIKYMYTYWPNPKNTTFIREQYIHVSKYEDLDNFHFYSISPKFNLLIILLHIFFRENNSAVI